MQIDIQTLEEQEPHAPTVRDEEQSTHCDLEWARGETCKSTEEEKVKLSDREVFES